MEIKKIDIETLKLKAVEPDVNQRNTRVFKKKTVDLMMKIKKQNEDRSKTKGKSNGKSK
tara:strand:- start:93 stop:269 length:177 start_codon:yes stop_codon:yes gene_type:complete